MIDGLIFYRNLAFNLKTERKAHFTCICLCKNEWNQLEVSPRGTDNLLEERHKGTGESSPMAEKCGDKLSITDPEGKGPGYGWVE